MFSRYFWEMADNILSSTESQGFVDLDLNLFSKTHHPVERSRRLNLKYEKNISLIWSLHFGTIWDVLGDLEPFIQFKKREKHSWRSVPAETCNFTKSKTPQRVFSTFFKLYKLYQIAQSITYCWNKVLRWVCIPVFISTLILYCCHPSLKKVCNFSTFSLYKQFYFSKFWVFSRVR